jgi:hypothetical protein
VAQRDFFVAYFYQDIMKEASQKRGRDQSQIQQKWWQKKQYIVEENALLKQDRA